MKRLIIVAVVLLLVGLVTWLALRGRSAAPAPAPPPPTAKVQRGNILLTVEATGSVESNLDVEIKSKASGEVIELPYDVSDRVPKFVPGRNDKDALLVALEPIDEQRNVQRAEALHDAARARLEQSRQNLAIAVIQQQASRPRAEANLAAAKAKAQLAEITLQRLKRLLEKNTVAQQEVDAAQADLEVAQAQERISQAGVEELKTLEASVSLRQAEVDLAQASLAGTQVDLADTKRRLEETRIYSPIDGVVTSRDVSIGQIVASGIINVGGGTALMTVSDLSRIFVEAVVDESDIGRLVETGKLGQEVSITADAYPGRRFSGLIERITPRGVSEAKVVSFIVKIEVAGGGKELLLPKMTANVTIMANEKKDVLLIPNAAVQYDKDRPWVNLLRDGKFVIQYVKLGLNDGLQAEVVEGLSEGDQVQVGAGPRTRWSNEGRQPADAAGQVPAADQADGADPS